MSSYFCRVSEVHTWNNVLLSICIPKPSIRFFFYILDILKAFPYSINALQGKYFTLSNLCYSCSLIFHLSLHVLTVSLRFLSVSPLISAFWLSPWLLLCELARSSAVVPLDHFSMGQCCHCWTLDNVLLLSLCRFITRYIIVPHSWLCSI